MKKMKFGIFGLGLVLHNPVHSLVQSVRWAEVGNISIESFQCGLWVHKKCCCIVGKLVANQDCICLRWTHTIHFSENHA